MKFYTNKISTGKPTDFGQFLNKLASNNAAIKTASVVETATKTANLSNLGDKKAPPFGKKEEDVDKKEKKDDKTEEKEACGTACASTEKEVKIAEDKAEKGNKDGEMHVEMQEMDPVGGANTGKPEGEKKETKSASAKKASNCDVAPENKGVTHKVDECCGAPTSKGDDKSEGEKSKKSDKKEEKEASKKPSFIRIANLDSKTKTEWKNYWKKLYPSDYVEAMFADK